LCGDSKGNLQWYTSNYTDIAGSAMTVHPCCSESEALVWIKDYVVKTATQLNIDGGKPESSVSAVYTTCTKYGIDIPESIAVAHKKLELQLAKEAYAASLTELDRVQKAYNLASENLTKLGEQL
jgi:hypothetical protein